MGTNICRSIFSNDDAKAYVVKALSSGLWCSNGLIVVNSKTRRISMHTRCVPWSCWNYQCNHFSYLDILTEKTCNACFTTFVKVASAYFFIAVCVCVCVLFIHQSAL